jgi:Sigma-54 interaction domain
MRCDSTSKSIVADVRIIAATNTDLKRHVDDRRFREDLYYRLNILSLAIPPLRERLGDIPALVARFVRRSAHEAGRGADGSAGEGSRKTALDRLRSAEDPVDLLRLVRQSVNKGSAAYPRLGTGLRAVRVHLRRSCMWLPTIDEIAAQYISLARRLVNDV